MSAPPPGGSPPPESPTPYPQYPPQGYPPQYPPQQPYAPPTTPPPKEFHTALIIILVVVVVIVVLAIAAWWFVTSLMTPVTQSQITVSGVSFAINYPGSRQYFGASPITSCANCPIHTSLLKQFTYTLTLHNTDSADHNVTSVTLSGTDFTIFTAVPDPSLASPVVVPAGGTQSIVLTIQPTTVFAGSYTLSGVIDTG